MADIKIHQIYYKEDQKKYLDNGFSPWDNLENLHPEWAELWVMIQAWKNSSESFSELTGFVSWNFHKKTGLQSQEVSDFINSNPGYDCYIFNPLTLQTSLFTNVWEQGERWHPGIKNKAKDILNKCGVKTDLDSYVDTFASTVYCNYFVAVPRFWKAYFAMVTTLIDYMKIHQDERFRLMDTTLHRHHQYSYFPFVMERMYGVVIRLNPGLKILPYRYPKDQQSVRTPGFAEFIDLADIYKAICRDNKNSASFKEYLLYQRMMNDLLRRTPDAEKLLLS